MVVEYCCGFQDVGRLLGLTNTGGTIVGVICNLLTGISQLSFRKARCEKPGVCLTVSAPYIVMFLVLLRFRSILICRFIGWRAIWVLKRLLYLRRCLLLVLHHLEPLHEGRACAVDVRKKLFDLEARQSSG